MMDRALKERIIGAVILVLFVVLVVPVFLDGPPTDEVVSEHVTLPGQSEQQSQTIVLERDREDPVPAAANTRQAEPAQQAVAVAAEKPPAPAAPAAATPAPTTDTDEAGPPSEPAVSRRATSSPTGMWAVQLGSFGNQENAERLAADLRKQGFAAFLSQLSTGGDDLHRVRIGPQKDRESAEAMAERLAKAGHTGQVVPHP